MTVDDVILVNENDEPIGEMEKLEAHRRALLHRALSVFIFDSSGRMLLQQRADGKYHSGGLWTNACCSHPRPGEDTRAAARRRLLEEMGFVTELEELYTFTYRAEFDNGLTEHEFDHVFTGIYDGEINPDRNEVKDYCFKPMETIADELGLVPAKFTPWFRIAFPVVKQKIQLACTGWHIRE